MRTTSFHRTIDGYNIVIEYEGDMKHLVVSDIGFGKCTDPNIYVYANILPMDMPKIK